MFYSLFVFVSLYPRNRHITCSLDQIPNPETNIFFTKKGLYIFKEQQIGFFSQPLHIFPVFCIPFKPHMKLQNDQIWIKTNSKFCDLNSGSLDSQIGYLI